MLQVFANMAEDFFNQSKPNTRICVREAIYYSNIIVPNLPESLMPDKLVTGVRTLPPPQPWERVCVRARWQHRDTHARAMYVDLRLTCLVLFSLATLRARNIKMYSLSANGGASAAPDLRYIDFDIWPSSGWFASLSPPPPYPLPPQPHTA